MKKYICTVCAYYAKKKEISCIRRKKLPFQTLSYEK